MDISFDRWKIVYTTSGYYFIFLYRMLNAIHIQICMNNTFNTCNITKFLFHVIYYNFKLNSYVLASSVALQVQISLKIG